MAQKYKLILISVFMILLIGWIIAEIVFSPRVNIHVETHLVDAGDKVFGLLDHQPLEEIKKAVESSGKGVDEATMYSGTYLYWAASAKRIDVAKWLLEKGANPNGVDPAMTPLRAAVMKNDLLMVKLLVQAGANPDIDPGDGLTPRRMAELNKFQKILDVFATCHASTQSGGKKQETTNNSSDPF